MSKLIKFSKKIKLDQPYLIAAWPGMGQVAYVAASYLIRKLGAQEFCAIDSEKYFYPSGIHINKGMIDMAPTPKSRFYFFKNNNIELIILLCDAQPDLSNSIEYANLIFDICEKVSRKIRCVFNFAAMPAPIDHVQKPQVYVASTTKAYLSRFKAVGLEFINRSQVSGMNGLFQGVTKQRQIDGICLLSQIPLYSVQIENPRAAIEILEKLSKLLGIKIDMARLHKDAEQIEEQINRFVEYFKESFQESEDEPITRDELERIKHALSQYTKLPGSAKLRIEKLFEEAKQDLSKAKELKLELDKWSIYPEYEDRFLDLFKRQRKQDN